MCGIIGYIGHKPALPVLLEGLKRMEYRGYDSAGVALLAAAHTTVIKRPGKIATLAEALDETLPATTHATTRRATLGIGHTRWATHGTPSEVNAHPHTSGPITIVHNGIIENYAELKSALIARGHRFTSDTDTEVLAHLIDAELQEAAPAPAATEAKTAHPTTKPALLTAVLAALGQVRGTFGLLVLSEREPDLLIAARRGSPLLLSLTDDAVYAASDATAIIGHTDRVIYLDDDEVAILRPGQYDIIDLAAAPKRPTEHRLTLDRGSIEKSGYDHFLLKEIMEQPHSVRATLRGRLDPTRGTSHLGGLGLADADLARLTQITTVACGTAYYAGLLGKYLLERLTRLPISVETASEFRYRQAVIADPAHTLGLLISQSGETADTLASLRELKSRAVPTLGLVNVVGSSIAREVDGGVYLHVGPEISVASTKAFTSQVVAQLLLGLKLAHARGLDPAIGQEVAAALDALPAQIARVLKSAPHIKSLARKHAHHDHVMYLGRDTLYPVALEGALKLKEISYIHTEAHPAGEMKHGPNALIDPDLLVVFLAPRNALYEKSRSNLEEVRARRGRLLIVGTEGDESLADFSDDLIYIPECSPWTLPLLTNIPLQLLAYYIAVRRGTDVDQPRNLAKSVTVE